MIALQNGAVHKVRHAIFDHFWPTSPVIKCHTWPDRSFIGRHIIFIYLSYLIFIKYTYNFYVCARIVIQSLFEFGFQNSFFIRHSWRSNRNDEFSEMMCCRSISDSCYNYCCCYCSCCYCCCSCCCRCFCCCSCMRWYSTSVWGTSRPKYLYIVSVSTAAKNPA